MSIGDIWDLVILSPMINVLVMLSRYLFNNFGLTIIVLTIIIQGLMYPLRIKQLKATKAMQSIQSQVAELQKKYGKDKQALAREQMKLYREAGMSPAGCLLPMLVQMPVWIALYQSIIRVLAVAPEDFLNLSQHLYPSWPAVFSLVPLESKFLWLDLSSPDRWLLLPVLVGATMWVQQKMVTPTSTDPKQQAQSQLMLWMMPLMFAFLTLSFPSGLALYWVTSNIISVAMQYFVTGWGGLITPKTTGKKGTTEKKLKGQAVRLAAPAEKTETVIAPTEPSPAREEVSNGKSGDERKDRGGGYPPRPGTARRRPGGGGGRGRKRR